jgi:hypothetical protein
VHHSWRHRSGSWVLASADPRVMHGGPDTRMLGAPKPPRVPPPVPCSKRSAPLGSINHESRYARSPCPVRAGGRTGSRTSPSGAVAMRGPVSRSHRC